MRFFIDTADVDYIKRLLAMFAKYEVPFDNIAGVTTNPNAMAKVDAVTLDDFTAQVKMLTSLMASITGDTESWKEVFVQIPNSHMNSDEIVAFIDYCIGNLGGDDSATVGIKIPPYITVLADVEDMFLKADDNNGCIFNVTGVADAATALFALSFPEVEYVSIIPGRMNEVGIDYLAHCIYTKLAYTQPYQKLIAGSMRTIEQVIETVSFGMIPTIGTRVWDLFFDAPEKFQLLSEPMKPNVEAIMRLARGDFNFAPLADERNLKLSTEFFVQMDKLGAPLYKEFFNK